VNGVAMSAATVLSLLAISWKRSPGFVLLAGALVSFPVAHYLVQGEQRYRYPVLWMSVLLAAVGVERALDRWGRLRRGTAAATAVLR
jgi:hypothetical protein